MRFSKRNRSIAVLLLLSLSFAFSGCQMLSSASTDDLTARLEELYPDDDFEYVSRNGGGILFFESENYPDRDVCIRNDEGVIECNYLGICYGDIVQERFADLGTEYFGCDSAGSSWVGRTMYYPFEEISEEDFMVNYVYDRMNVWLFYDSIEDFPDEEKIVEAAAGIANELNAPCNITLGVYLTSEPEEKRNYMTIYLVCDRAGHVESLNVESTRRVYEDKVE